MNRPAIDEVPRINGGFLLSSDGDTLFFFVKNACDRIKFRNFRHGE